MTIDDDYLRVDNDFHVPGSCWR